MSAWAMTTSANGEFTQSACADAVTGTSSVDTWIGRRLRTKRTMRGLTQREFCELLNIDQNDLVAFEAGTKRIKANRLFRIAKLLDVQPDYFFRGYVEEAPGA